MYAALLSYTEEGQDWAPRCPPIAAGALSFSRSRSEPGEGPARAWRGIEISAPPLFDEPRAWSLQLALPRLDRAGFGSVVGCRCARCFARLWQWLFAGVEDLRKAPRARRGARHVASPRPDRSALPIEAPLASKLCARPGGKVDCWPPKDCHTGEAMRLGVSEPGLRLGPVEVHKYAG